MPFSVDSLINGVKIGGAASKLAHAEESDMSRSLYISPNLLYNYCTISRRKLCRKTRQ